jgi:hypothetical protein
VPGAASIRAPRATRAERETRTRPRDEIRSRRSRSSSRVELTGMRRFVG